MNEPMDEKITRHCCYCGNEFVIENNCAEEVYTCANCMEKTVKEIIFEGCLSSDNTAPIDTAMHLMKFPGFKMHCPEHHFLVPAVLLSSYSNYVGNEKEKLEKWLMAANQRSEKVPGAFCGTHGSCGAAVGTGMFISIITGATPYKTEEWRLANSMTGRSLLSMAAHGGPRCCKRVSFIAIQEACAFLTSSFGVSLPLPKKIECPFHPKNEECLKKECPFYPTL